MLLDNFVIFVLFMLMVCARMAFIYCFHYFGGSSRGRALFPLVVWFVGVMGSLVLSGSYLFRLVLWEYLGFVRFLLIVFYSSRGSMRAAVVTLVSSRFGDVGFFVLLGALGGAGVVPRRYIVGARVLFIILRKRASYPFVSWLLEAMRAPTPVRSLVHSSTLVAAGV